ncbi:hypothetical protein GpartN1_g4604.t1 [Galdieria partita]|uniref:Glycosyltransferase 61 catalytic domain-containing protein n=1 Tax=Galdieria partita TaxID=83374 RepID=A0A9C7PXY7_9RHOD|nr:hypothetical protein GpartN1_g4604.t1 [Galdieria partita]
MRRAFKMMDCTKQGSYQSSTFERSLTNPLITNFTLSSTEHIIHWYNFCLDKDEHWLWMQSHKLHQHLCAFHCYKSSYASKRPEVRMWTSLKSHHYTSQQRSFHHLPINGTLLRVPTGNQPSLFPYPLFIARHNQHLPHFLEELLAAYSIVSSVDSMPELKLISKYQIVFIAFPSVAENLILNPQTWHGNIVKMVKETIQHYFDIELVIKGAETFLEIRRGLKSPFLCFDHIFYNTRAAQRPESYTHWLYSNVAGERLQKIIHMKLQSPTFAQFSPEAYSKIVMIQRNTTRRICQAETIAVELQRTFGVKVSIVLFEHLSALQQAQLMHRSSIVIAAHGASLSNIIFMRRGSILIELSPYLCSGEGYFGALAKFLGLHYFHLSGIQKEINRSSKVQPRNGCSKIHRNRDIHLNIEELLLVFHTAMNYLNNDNK